MSGAKRNEERNGIIPLTFRQNFLLQKKEIYDKIMLTYNINHISPMNKNTQYILNYKQEMKDCPIITRIKILKPLLEKKITQKEMANSLWIWKNTVNNTVALFKSNSKDWDKDIIINSHTYNYDFLRQKFEYLWYKSRAPNSHSRSIEKDSLIGKKIISLHKEINKWYKNMNTFLEKNLWIKKYKKYWITEAKIRWFYKRNNLIYKKVKSENREYRSPFDFQKTMAFSRLYFDIKHIPDQHALPTEIYNKFKYWVDKDGVLIEWLPKYELNVMEQNTRIRFIVYLTELDTNLIFWFIELVLQFIRWNNFVPFSETIILWTDGWSEFFSGSERKRKEWEEKLSYLNVSFYSYESAKDPRKNLIERSHLSDDSEFYIPRWFFINSKDDFLKEAKDRNYYRNFERHHSWRFMDNLTPIEKAKKLGIYNIDIIKIFPTFILQNHYLIIHNIKKSQNVLTQDHLKRIFAWQENKNQYHNNYYN